MKRLTLRQWIIGIGAAVLGSFAGGWLSDHHHYDVLALLLIGSGIGAVIWEQRKKRERDPREAE
jgi:uncharacterized membrane protein YfcA